MALEVYAVQPGVTLWCVGCGIFDVFNCIFVAVLILLLYFCCILLYFECWIIVGFYRKA